MRAAEELRQRQIAEQRAIYERWHWYGGLRPPGYIEDPRFPHPNPTIGELEHPTVYGFSPVNLFGDWDVFPDPYYGQYGYAAGIYHLTN